MWTFFVTVRENVGQKGDREEGDRRRLNVIEHLLLDALWNVQYLKLNVSIHDGHDQLLPHSVE